MKSKRIRLGMIAALALALVAGVAVWTGSIPFARVLFAQTAQQADGEHADADDGVGHTDGCDSCGSHGKTPAAKDDHDETCTDGHDAPDGAHEGGHTDKTDGHDDHEGEDHDDNAGHDRDEKVSTLSLGFSPEQMSRFGVTLAAAGPGTLHRQIRLPGEIVVNADRAGHVVPPAGGVARKVNVNVGDFVSAGQAMAVLESAELSEAKTQYLIKLNELTCCSVELTRAQALDASARELLKVLEKSPTLDQLQTVKLAAMAQGHSKLIAVYAEFVFARAEYEREKKLVEQDVSSRADFQTATSAYKKAFAEFVAGRDGLAYETQRSLLEAQQSRKNMELELRATVQRLRILGVSSQELQALKGAPQGGGTVDPDCDDPNCTECEDHKATTRPAATETTSRPKGAPQGGGTADPDCDDPNCTECEDHKTTTRPAATEMTSSLVLGEQLGVYPLRAPFAGTVIDKHITLGEMLSNDAPVFTVADLSTVWVDLSVYQKDLPHVGKGQIVHIALGKETPSVQGKIAFVSPIVDSGTRTAKARIILANPKGVYRPGLFVTADIDVLAMSVPVLVPKAAVQRIEGQNVVFVLRAGQKYVAKGAFQLKAQIVTSGLGAHAGHGH